MSCIHLFATGLGAASGVAVLGSGLVWTFSACHASLSLSCFSAHARCSENANLCFIYILTSFQAAAQSKSALQKVHWDKFLISEQPVLILEEQNCCFGFKKQPEAHRQCQRSSEMLLVGLKLSCQTCWTWKHHIWGKSEANPINKAVIFRFPYLELLVPESFLL